MSVRQLLKSENYCLFTFTTTHAALEAEKVLEQEKLRFMTCPVPREISAGCGIAIRFFCEDLKALVDKLNENKITYQKIYNVEKVNGEKIFKLL